MFENSVITNAGIEMLNAWAAGGEMTIDGATAGSGTAAAASLPSQTALVNTVQQPKIASKKVHNDRLELVVELSAASAQYHFMVHSRTKRHAGLHLCPARHHLRGADGHHGGDGGSERRGHRVGRDRGTGGVGHVGGGNGIRQPLRDRAAGHARGGERADVVSAPGLRRERDGQYGAPLCDV